MNLSSPRVMIVGCGGIARAHAAAAHAAAARAGSIVALCNANLDVARQLQSELGLDTPCYDSLQAAFAATNVDVVIVCTPPTTHFELVQTALQSGADVLCEKPLATRVGDARALVELAQNNGRRLRTSAKYRFEAGVCAAKNRLKSGEAGARRSGRAAKRARGEAGARRNGRIVFGAPFDCARSWHSQFRLSGGGVWMDNGPHALDLARFLAGDLTVDSILEWHCQGDVETEVAVDLRGANGVAVSIELSWQRALGEWFAEMECERGTLRVGWHRSQWQPRVGQAQVIATGYDKIAAFRAQWRGFSDGDTRFEVAAGARTVELLEAAMSLM